MNFLFATVLVLLLVAPGLAFFRTYYSGRFSIKYSQLTITDQVFRSLVPGITFQLFLFWVIQSCTDYTVRLDMIGVLMTGAKEDKTVLEAFGLLRSSLGSIIIYYLIINVLAAILGWGCRVLVRRRKWDRRVQWLRYDNHWYYLLSGEAVETPEYRSVFPQIDAKEIDFVFVDALVELEAGSTIYSGVLVDYQLGSDGGLTSLCLWATQRKFLQTALDHPIPTAESEKDGELTAPAPSKPNEYYPVRGQLMVIPFEKIINLNISYWVDEDVEVEEEKNEAENKGG